MKITKILLGVISVLGLLTGAEILLNTSPGLSKAVLYNTVGESLFFISFSLLAYLMIKKGYSKGATSAIFR